MAIARLGPGRQITISGWSPFDAAPWGASWRVGWRTKDRRTEPHCTRRGIQYPYVRAAASYDLKSANLFGGLAVVVLAVVVLRLRRGNQVVEDACLAAVVVLLGRGLCAGASKADNRSRDYDGGSPFHPSTVAGGLDEGNKARLPKRGMPCPKRRAPVQWGKDRRALVSLRRPNDMV